MIPMISRGAITIIMTRVPAMDKQKMAVGSMKNMTTKYTIANQRY
jgi:hypothetical protein